jgi:predicted ferric reductase
MYLVLALVPVSLMLSPPLDPPREPLREFAVALGFGAIGILGMQFVLSARLSRLKAPYGIDVVYYFHRRMATLALGLVLAHPILLIIVTPERLTLLNIFNAPWAARYGVTTVLVIAGIVITSLWRARFGLVYESWRGLHNVLAVTILALATLHVINTGIYTADWKRYAFMAYPAVWAGLLAYTRLGRPLGRMRRPYRVEEVRRETPDTWTLSIRPKGHRGITFRPGQFAWFTLGRSPFSFEEHPFSFSSSPLADSGAFDITVKELGDFTSTIGQTETGTVAYVDGPFGAFTTQRYAAARYTFIAGGVGITPIISMLRTAVLAHDQTPMTLIYAARSREDLAFAEELDGMSERISLATTYVLQDPPEEWEGATGLATREVLEQAIADPGNEEYFVCGPPAMMSAVEKTLAQMDVKRRRIHYERFSFDREA